ncbi:MAG: hypothetical protein LBP53_08105 [Candidatus Peribacteria bacterium]|jgi:hypothetical protein|nr:hypothetical protein [Candidatus Peribacteria bacterium]
MEKGHDKLFMTAMKDVENILTIIMLFLYLYNFISLIRMNRITISHPNLQQHSVVICLFLLMGLMILSGCGNEPLAPDTTEVVGQETLEDCPFGCILGNNWKIGGREGYAIEISKFTSPALGISFLYPSAQFYEYDGSHRETARNEIMHTGNAICVKENEEQKFVSGKERSCVEFLSYEEWQNLETSFEVGETRGIKKQIASLPLYFVEYHCIACGP